MIHPTPVRSRERARGTGSVPEVLLAEPEDDLLQVEPPLAEVASILPEWAQEQLGVWGSIRLIFWVIWWVWEWCFGIVSLIVGLAFLAAIPVLNFLTLGYLLEVGGRMGRSGRFFSCFIGVRPAARVGSIVLGTYLMTIPLQLVSSMWQSAEIIDPGGTAARGWKTALFFSTVLVGFHILLACLSGGRLRNFFLPPLNVIYLVRCLIRGQYYSAARDAVWKFVTDLRLPYYFWLGVRGFVGALLWLALPVSMLAGGFKFPPLGVLGGVILGLVLLVLPFLQMHFAATQRFRSFFELGQVLTRYGRAPWAFAFALFLTLLLAFPLYVFKIEMVDRDYGPAITLFFIVSMWPARVMAGWAYGRSSKRTTPRHPFFAATGLMVMLPSAALYVLFLFVTRYTSWNGVWSLYEQHPFLLPVPFTAW